jgi:hypothetical protein
VVSRAGYEPFAIYNREVTIIGSMAIAYSYGAAIDVLLAGAVETGKMVTHTLPLERFAEAVELVRRGEGLKVHIDPSFSMSPQPSAISYQDSAGHHASPASGYLTADS